MTQAMQRLVVAMMVWLLSACASTPVTQAQVDADRRSEFDKSLDGWHGATIHELVAKLGPPSSKSRQADGTLVYVYAKSTKLKGPVGPIMFSCVVRYMVDAHAGRVVGHRIEGC